MPTEFRLGEFDAFLSYVVEAPNTTIPGALRYAADTFGYFRTALQDRYHHYELSLGRFADMVAQSARSLMFTRMWSGDRVVSVRLLSHPYLFGTTTKINSRYGIVERTTRGVITNNRRVLIGGWSLVADAFARRLITKFLAATPPGSWNPDNLVTEVRGEFEALMRDMGIAISHDDNMFASLSTEEPEIPNDE